jgi:hypothetical protein
MQLDKTYVSLKVLVAKATEHHSPAIGPQGGKGGGKGSTMMARKTAITAINRLKISNKNKDGEEDSDGICFDRKSRWRRKKTEPAVRYKTQKNNKNQASAEEAAEG